MDEYSLLTRIQKEITDPAKSFIFFAGYLQIKTQLDSDFLFELLSKIYSTDIEPQNLRKIETHLMNCNLAEVKNLLITQDRCLLCRKISGDLVYLDCIDSFHRKCLVDFLFSKVEDTITINCPVCNDEIQNLHNIDPRFQVRYREKINQKLNCSELNLTYCPNCGQLFEKDSKGPQDCLFCGTSIA